MCVIGVLLLKCWQTWKNRRKKSTGFLWPEFYLLWHWHHIFTIHNTYEIWMCNPLIIPDWVNCNSPNWFTVYFVLTSFRKYTLTWHYILYRDTWSYYRILNKKDHMRSVVEVQHVFWYVFGVFNVCTCVSFWWANFPMWDGTKSYLIWYLICMYCYPEWTRHHINLMNLWTSDIQKGIYIFNTGMIIRR